MIPGKMNLVIASKLQISRMVFYWAVLTFALAIVWSILLNALRLRGIGAAVSLAVPMLLGALLSVFLYFAHEHYRLEYDDEGYSITKGKRSRERHRWSEFEECSVVRDNYGRNKVRVYLDRDGNHIDIDSSACGINPYALRDFIMTRIHGPNVRRESPSNYDIFDRLEEEIHRGRARWIADLNETFRSHRISGEVFPLTARGGTRPRGFLLSRFIAATVMPDYQVSLYAYDLSDRERATKSRLLTLVRLIESMRDEKKIKWSWLLLLSNEGMPTSVAKFIEQFGNQDIGVGCMDIASGNMITSPNQLGRSLSKQMRLDRLIRDLNRRRIGWQNP